MKNAFRLPQFKAAKALKIGLNSIARMIYLTILAGSYLLIPLRFEHLNSLSLFQYPQSKHGQVSVAGHQKNLLRARYLSKWFSESVGRPRSYLL